MRRVCRRRTLTACARATVIIAVALALAASAPTVGSTAARGSGIGVVDFYATGPLRPFEGVAPEAMAADDLADLVARSAGTQITVIPRATVRQAESAIRWQGSDVLRFARLQELARALDADLLLVGRIDRLDLDRGSGGGAQSRARHLATGFAAVTVQVFDPRQGRVVSQVERSAYEVGIVDARVAERLIRRVVEATVPSVLSAIGSAGRAPRIRPRPDSSSEPDRSAEACRLGRS
jgi:hypothetical protein